MEYEKLWFYVNFVLSTQSNMIIILVLPKKLIGPYTKKPYGLRYTFETFRSYFKYILDMPNKRNFVKSKNCGSYDFFLKSSI